jgi:outer membrane assembly lipoprotein YfiO
MRFITRTAWTVAVVLGVAWTAQAQWTWTPQTGRWVNLKRMPKETAELQIEHARSLMVQGDYKRALRETEKFVQFYAGDPLSDQNQFLRGEIRMAQGNWMDAAKEFQQVIAGYPNTSMYEQAIAKQYEIGDQLYAKGQQKIQKRWAFNRKKPLKRAIDVYAMVVDNQPFTAAAAQAQYKIGLCHYTRKEYTEAAYEYQRVIEDYGASDWVDEASYGLVSCYYDGSLPPDYDQSNSMLAIDAIDDYVSKYPDDARGADLKEKRGEMRALVAEQRIRTAKFYEQRRKFDSARLCYEVVVKDFSDTPWAEKAQAWLDAHPVNKNPGRLAFETGLQQR